jgi:hypothetical protein
MQSPQNRNRIPALYINSISTAFESEQHLAMKDSVRAYPSPIFHREGRAKKISTRIARLQRMQDAALVDNELKK